MVRFILVFLFTNTGLFLQARQWHVGAGQQHTSIVVALQACSAGDTVVVHSGLYREGNLIIRKSISLLGLGGPVLDGEGKHEILTIKANNVLVMGLVLRHTAHGSLEDYAGIKVYDSANVRIISNTLENTFFGIYLSNVQQALVHSNYLHSQAQTESQAGNGIHLWKCSGVQISNNTVSGHRDGIYFEFVTQSNIHHNRSKGNMRYGIHFMFSHNDSYTHNHFENNGAGVAVMYSKHVCMQHNTFIHNLGSGAYGLLLKDITDGHIAHNQFVGNTTGLYMEGSNRLQVLRNTFKENGWALRLMANCSDNDIIQNNFLGNSFDVATNGNLVLNRFASNYWDRYKGYDLNRDQVGDVHYSPVSLFAVVIENIPAAILLSRSIMVDLLDRAEKMLPSLTPGDLFDAAPAMHPYSE